MKYFTLSSPSFDRSDRTALRRCIESWDAGRWGAVFTSSLLLFACCVVTGRADVVNVAGRQFEIPTGFTLELAASSEFTPRPIVADFNETGELFVADSSGSNDKVQTQLEQRPHRILRLRDTNGDGVFDQQNVFADKMMFPEGLMAYRGSVYVAAPPQIWQLTDADGDGVAEQRRVWFDGQTLTGCANDLHGPYLGRDGWIYWCKGAFAEQTYARADGTTWSTRASHVFRRRLEGGIIEPVMSGGMDNPVDVVMTGGGERIFTTTFLQHPAGGNRDGLIHALYGGLYGKVHGVLDGHVRTGDLLPPLCHMGPAAPCGLAVVESDRLGHDFTGNLVSCAFNLHQVVRHRLQPQGATYTTFPEPLVTGSDLDFHPTDVIEDADGSLLIVDTGGWYKLCCPSSQLQKPDVLGGIYRLKRVSEKVDPNTDAAHTWQDPRGVKLEWANASSRELAHRLADHRPAVSQQATDQLRRRGAGAIGDMMQVFTDAKTPALGRRNAVWTLAPMDSDAVWPLIAAGLKDVNSEVRQATWHVVSVRREQRAATNLAKGWGLRDENPAVRRAAAEAAGRIGDVNTVPILLEALERAGEDRFLEHSLIYALIELNQVAALRENLASDTPARRRGCLIALDQLADGQVQATDVLSVLTHENKPLRTTANWIFGRHREWLTDLAARLTAEQDRLAAGAEVTRELAQLIVESADAVAVQDALARMLTANANAASTNEIKPRYVREVLASGRPQALAAALQEAIAGQLASPSPAHNEATRTAWFATLAEIPAEIESDRLVKQLCAVVESTDSSPTDRRLAMAALHGKSPIVPADLFDQLISDLESSEDHQMRRVAASTLATSPLSKQQRQRLLAVLPKVGTVELPVLLQAFRAAGDPELGSLAWQMLQRNPAWVVVPAESIRDAFAGYEDSLRTNVAETLDTRTLADADQAARLAELLEQLPSGDVRRGQRVFHSAKAACFSCHALGYRGGDVGPDLTRIGSVRSRRDLLESIVFPSASFVRSFEPVSIVTHNGAVFQGLIKDENSQRVKLVDSQRQILEISRTDIDELLPSSVSVMPSGMDRLLDTQELSDVLEFLLNAK